MYKNKKDPHLQYFHVDHQPPFEGLPKYLRKRYPVHPVTLLYQTSGGEGSLAHRICEFFQHDVYQYPYQKRYLQLPGPNCNAFTQRIINAFPEIGIALPKRARGKSYRVR